MSQSNSKTSTATTTQESAVNQEQAIEGSGNLALGAGSSGNNVSISTDDLQQTTEALGAATTISGQAIAANNNVSLAAIAQSGADAGLVTQADVDAVHSEAATAGAALTTTGELANSAIGAVTGLAAQNETNTANFTSALDDITGQALQVASNAQTNAFQIAANAAPQTQAAETENLSGRSPIRVANANLSAGNSGTLLLVGGAVILAVILLK